VKIVARKTLEAYWARHAETQRPLSEWLRIVRGARWASMRDVKAAFPKASVITSARAVFNIHGNNYRLIVEINFRVQVVFIRFIGTHKEYDAVDAGTVKEH
jgi:mRNA interferase HigB